ncbi:hypothetical protein [Pseudomonas sp. PWP3-1b2]|uniref:hypothetical protein n=1 Tax=Pseudomonas sp. PWP3-1b2 TaxID=2804656 RepID=UPI003CF86EAD
MSTLLNLASDTKTPRSVKGTAEGTIGEHSFNFATGTVTYHNGKVQLTLSDKDDAETWEDIYMEFPDIVQPNAKLPLKGQKLVNIWISFVKSKDSSSLECPEGDLVIEELVLSPLKVKGTICATTESTKEKVEIKFDVTTV